MRNPVAVAVLLSVLGLVSVVVWGALLLGTDQRYYQGAIAIVLTPIAVGGLLMVVGARFIPGKIRAARITATVGAGMVLAYGLFAFAFWYLTSGDRVRLDGVGFLVFTLAHAVLIALVWRKPAPAA